MHNCGPKTAVVSQSHELVFEFHQGLYYTNPNKTEGGKKLPNHKQVFILKHQHRYNLKDFSPFHPLSIAYTHTVGLEPEKMSPSAGSGSFLPLPLHHTPLSSCAVSSAASDTHSPCSLTPTSGGARLR